MSDEIDNGRRDFLGHGAVAAGAIALAAGAVTATISEGSTNPATDHHDPPVSDKMTLENDDLKKLIKMTSVLPGIRPLGWCAYGQPALDGVCGTLELPGGKIGDLAAVLAKWKGTIPIGVSFPYGIPADLGRAVLVNIRAGAHNIKEG